LSYFTDFLNDSQNIFSFLKYSFQNIFSKPVEKWKNKEYISYKLKSLDGNALLMEVMEKHIIEIVFPHLPHPLGKLFKNCIEFSTLPQGHLSAQHAEKFIYKLIQIFQHIGAYIFS